MNRRQIGTDYEQLAADYLQEQGFHILERNFRIRTGEIDIIAEENKVICFVEVKYRRTDNCGLPSQAVDFRKRKNISRVAMVYLLRHGLTEWTPCRFDVVSLSGSPQKGLEILLIRNAFEYCP